MCTLRFFEGRLLDGQIMMKCGKVLAHQEGLIALFTLSCVDHKDR